MWTFSISENPNFRFYFVPNGEGELEAKVVDNQDLEFTAHMKLDSARRSARFDAALASPKGAVAAADRRETCQSLVRICHQGRTSWTFVPQSRIAPGRRW